MEERLAYKESRETEVIVVQVVILAFRGQKEAEDIQDTLVPKEAMLVE